MPAFAASRIRNAAALAALLLGAGGMIAGFEGVRRTAYLDPVGIPTICFGETRGVKLGDRATMAECEAMLESAVLEHEAGMAACLKHPEAIPDRTWAAFVSFTYNVGVAAFCGSAIRALLDAGQIRRACDQLPRWVHAGGVRLPGLVKRRAAERALCLEDLR